MRVAPDKLDHSENVGVALSQNLLAPVTATVTLYSTGALGISIKDQADSIADAPEVAKGSSTDDDLTSLTWLQDKNLLKAGVRQLPKNEAGKNKTASSTTTDVVLVPTECASKPSVSFEMSKCKDADPVPFSYDPQIHIQAKPPFSFSCLIFMAIEDSALKALPVRDIYLWIIEHFPYYRNAPTGWKNSVRHNLSLNKCFKKADKPLNLGKGSLWMVEQRHRTALIQALRKSPYQYNKFLRNLKVNPETSQDVNCVKNEPEDNMMPPMQPLPNPPMKNAVAAYTFDPMELYRRGETLDDVHAAEAMLVLKHGACALDAFNITPETLVAANTYQPSATTNGYLVEERKPSVTSYPSEDHNYVYDTCMATPVNDIPGNMEEITTTSYFINSNEDAEEQRKIVEGADALLNLAGIRTYNTRKRYASSSSEEIVGNGVAAAQLHSNQQQQQIQRSSKFAVKPLESRPLPAALEIHQRQQSSSSMKLIKLGEDSEGTESDTDSKLLFQSTSSSWKNTATNNQQQSRFGATKNHGVVGGVGINSGGIRKSRKKKTIKRRKTGNSRSYMYGRNSEDDDTETASEEDDGGKMLSTSSKRKMKKNGGVNGVADKISLRRTSRTKLASSPAYDNNVVVVKNVINGAAANGGLVAKKMITMTKRCRRKTR